MSKVKLVTKSFYLDSHGFRSSLLSSLTKLNENTTKKLGLDEIRSLLINQVQDLDRINLLLSILSENNEHHKMNGKRESVKIIRILAELFQENMIKLLPRIAYLASKKLQEDDAQLHENLSEALADLVRISLDRVHVNIACNSIRILLAKLFQLCIKETRHTQTGAALCLSKIIQATPFHCLDVLLPEISSKITETLMLVSCKAHVQLFECVLSYMMAFKDFRGRLERTSKDLLPVAIHNMSHSDWNVRRIAVQVLHVMSILNPELVRAIIPEALYALNNCRFDKIKNVRDASVKTLAYIQKKFNPPQSPKRICEQLKVDFPSPLSPSRSRERIRTSSRGASFEKKCWPILEMEHESLTAVTSPKQCSSKARPKSVEGKRNRVINHNFFNNAVKTQGDVEVFAKTPTPEPSIHSHLLSRAYSGMSNRVAELSTNVPTSKRHVEGHTRQRVYDLEELSCNNLISDDNDGDGTLLDSPTKINPRQQTYIKESERDRVLPRRERLDIPVNSIRGSAASLELGCLNDKDRSTPVVPQTSSANKLRTPTLLEEDSQNNIDNLVQEMSTLNKQQTKTIETISGFHTTTHNELDRIKNRIGHLEDFLQYTRNAKEAPPSITTAPPQLTSQPSLSYTYSPPFSPPFTPTYNTGISSPFPVNYQPPQYVNYRPPGLQTPGLNPEVLPNHYLSLGLVHQPSAGMQSVYSPCLSANSVAMTNLPCENENGEHYFSSPGVNRKSIQTSRRSSPRKTLTKSPSYYKKQSDNKEPTMESLIIRPCGSKKEVVDEMVLDARIQELLDEDHINVAYELCLRRGTGDKILSLMIHTGNITKQLETPIVENLLLKIKSKIDDKSKCGLVVDWIEKVVEDGIEVSKETLKTLHDKLINRLEDKNSLSGCEYRRMKNLADNIEVILNPETKEIERME